MAYAVITHGRLCCIEDDYMDNELTMYYNYLAHHGVKGQKWGVRRYKNADGSLTPAGKIRYGADGRTQGNRSSNKTKKRIAAAVGVGAVATAAVYLHNNKAAQTLVKNTMSEIGKKTITSMKKNVNTGKTLTEAYIKSLRTGISEGMKNAPDQIKKGISEGITEGAKTGSKNLTKAVVIGGIMNAGHQAMSKSIGDDNTTKVFQANNKKKIDKYWKTN